MDADVQMEAARTAGADKYAPYEFTAAKLYLHKAREEVGFSDYEIAVELAKKATKYASEARDKATAATKSEGLAPPPLPSQTP